MGNGSKLQDIAPDLQDECKEEIKHMLDAEQKYRELAVSLTQLELSISLAENNGKKPVEMLGDASAEYTHTAVESNTLDRAHLFQVEAKHELKGESIESNRVA